MIEIAFITDAITDTNGLQPIYEQLRSSYEIQKLSYDKLKASAPKLVVTNLADRLGAIVTAYPTIFILTEASGQPVIRTNAQVRRMLLNPLKLARSVITYSRYAAQAIRESYRIKALVQLPVVRPCNILAPDSRIVHSAISDDIKTAFPNLEFVKFSCLDDLNGANLYIDMSSHDECHNLRLCYAAAYGVPCLAYNSGSNTELASGGDILLPREANDKQWITAIKVALRDRAINSDKNHKAAQRFRGMGELDGAIKKILGKRSTVPKMGDIARQQKIKKKLEALKAASRTKTPKGLVMGRRETLAEKQRRSRRFTRNTNARTRRNVKGRTPETTKFEVVDTPSWFTSNGKVDVSIIVPMYRSRNAIARQIASWDLSDDGLTKEIIYVDDCCPVNSHQVIPSCWERHRQHLKGQQIGKIITCEANRGYGPACNLGAKFASGKYLIFLNADTEVLSDWVRPMVQAFHDDPEVGIVGNLQLKSVGDKKIVDSAGSEFIWNGGHFEHIGRNIYHGKRLKSPFTIDQLPEDLREVGQREMVTGCCFMIPKQLFLEIGGYDEVYKVAYWEDSDMNMAVRQRGYKVLFQPHSMVIHTGGHSKVGGHRYSKQNRDRFYFRWVETGFLDKVAYNHRPAHNPEPNKSDLKSAVDGEVIGCVIACNEEEFLEASVRSVAPMVDKFIFVIGGNQYAYKSGMCDVQGYPIDNTLEIARKLGKEFNGTVIEPPGRLWDGKTEMRNAYAKHLKPGNWMFMLDGDEVYKEGQLWVLANKMQTYECFRMQYYTFWNNVDTLGIGAWEDYPQERLVKWKENYCYKAPNHLAVSDHTGREIAFRVPTYSGDERMFFHYSWVRPTEKIRQKMDYYQHQLRDEWGDKGTTGNYVEDVFLKWRSNPKTVKETHPRGGGQTCPFGGIHPYEVTKLIQANRLNF